MNVWHPKGACRGRRAAAYKRAINPRPAQKGHNGEEAKERVTELYNALVTTTGIEDDLLAAADLANVLGHPVYDCL